jgi:hypothetical protein
MFNTIAALSAGAPASDFVTDSKTTARENALQEELNESRGRIRELETQMQYATLSKAQGRRFNTV